MKQEIIRIDLNGVNCYLGKSEKGYVLFDTGGHMILDKSHTNRRSELLQQLEQAGVKPGLLKAIVLTHGDSDHAANAAFLREKYSTIIAMHPGDTKLVDKPSIDVMMESFRYRSIIYKVVFFFLKKQIQRITEKDLKDFEGFKPDVLLQEGDSLLQYGFEATIIHLPGHTDGSIGILTKEGELISGDILANMKKPSVAPNAVDFKSLRSSLKKLKPMNIVKFFPGHGNPFSAKEVKL